MPSTTAPLLRISGSGLRPMAVMKLLIMPVSSMRATHARVRRRKLMHMGSMISIYRKRCAVSPQFAM